MQINIVKVGYLETNCYVLVNNNKCLIIDPGDENDKIINEIKNYEVVGILITHRHFDHIGALHDILEIYKVPVFEFNNVEEKEYKIDEFKFRVIYTKGHTSDSISFYFLNENIIFSGDFLFKNTIGRTDLETSNYNEMLKSISKIKEYDNNIYVYPGHGDMTLLGHEKKYNPYF